MPGFGLVVNERNEILLIQRAYGKEKGQWSLPGGQRDRGESLKRTAVRETREETGIRMTADDLYYKSERHRFEIWRGKRIGGRLRIQRKECLDAAWFSSDMLPHDDNLAFGPDKRALGKWTDENPGSRRVHYPGRRKMGRAGFALVVNDSDEVLLIQRGAGGQASGVCRAVKLGRVRIGVAPPSIGRDRPLASSSPLSGCTTRTGTGLKYGWGYILRHP